MKLTRTKLKTAFDNRSFERGENYFEQGYVVRGIKFQDKLWGQVSGSRPEPYRVSVSLKNGEVESKCSCPVGYMCKHGVALALNWIKRSESFIDTSKIIESLRGKSKEELVVLIDNIIHSNPALIPKFELVMQKADAGSAEINLEAIKRRITYATSGNLNYYHIDGAVEELWEIYEIGERLKEKSKFKDAAEVYSRLVEGCTNAYDIGADDSNGNLGDLAHSCVESFNECMEKVDDTRFRDAMFMRAAKLYEREDYGLNTEDMFLGVVTKANIKKIEEELHRQLENYTQGYRRGDSFFSNYKREEVKEILVGLYEKIGRTADALELAQSDMRNIGDHVFTADILLQAGKYDEALETLRKCSKFKDFKENYKLANAYVKVIDALIWKGLSGKIDIQEAIEVAIFLIGRSPWSFNHEEYDRIKSIFQKLDAREKFVSTAKKRFIGTYALVELLLHEGDIGGAAEALETIEDIGGGQAIKVAVKAKTKGLKDLAKRMTSLALRSGYSYPYGGTKSKELVLIRELLSKASKDELDDIVLNLNVDDRLSLFIAEKLAVRSPGMVRQMLKEDLEAYETSKLMRIVDKLTESSPSEAQYLGDLWISKFVTRSHVYYDDVIKMLRLVKKAFLRSDGEIGWNKYISSFETKYRTRKKLVEKLRTSRLI